MSLPEVEQIELLPPRPADGFGTNPDAPDWGSTGSDLVRLGPDGRGPNGEMSGADRPNPREISNVVVDQHGADIPNAAGASDFLWMWGQFLDHDLSLSEPGHLESAPIPVPAGDPEFDPFGTGTAEIPFNRVDPSPTGGIPNVITAFMDASMIYGSTAATLAEMRVDGGKLLMIEDAYLQIDGMKVFTGDIRAAENVALLSMHTLFTREHNRMVEELAQRDPSLTDDELFEAARARVEALVQAITYNEFLPILIGKDAIAEYEGHDPSVNPQVSIEFSTAVFRMGHTLLSSHLQLVAENGDSEGALALRDAFMLPGFVNENGIESILRGAATQKAQEFDHMIVEDVRSFLFGPPGAGGLDLASLNIQRGRDLGIPTYNGLREAVGLAPVTSFDQISSDPEVAARLEAAYGDVALVDAWVGGLAEDALPAGMMGETFAAVMIDQFTRVRAGDPFWSEGRGFSQAELDELWSTRLSDVIARNSAIDDIQTDVFKAMARHAGDGGDDVLLGAEGADFMLGHAGHDVFGGFGGDDELRGGAGNDTLYGLAGDDLLWGDAGDDALLGADGDDLLHGGDGNDMLGGFAGGDTLEGGAGDDALYGLEGDDLLHGGAGNDVLMAGEGDDTLDGGEGDDMLDAGPGDKLLTGGAGGDWFHFDALGAGRSVLTDFDPDEDGLLFSNTGGSTPSLGYDGQHLTLDLDVDTSLVFENWGASHLAYLVDLIS